MTFYKEHYAFAQLKCCLKFRSSRCLTGVLQNRSSQKFHWKAPVLESDFNKVTGFQAFTPFYTEHLRWLLRKFSLAQPTCLLSVALYFLLPEAILNAINTALKKILWVQCKLHLLLA